MTQVHSHTVTGMSEEFLSYDDLRRVHRSVRRGYRKLREGEHKITKQNLNQIH